MTSDLGNRHSGNLDGKLLHSTRSGRVRISAGTKFARTQGGQHLLWMLINLLARQYGVVTALEIAVPAVGLHPSTTPFGEKSDLQATLLETTSLVAAGQMEVRAAALLTDDYECVSVECLDIRDAAWTATADGWNLHVGPGVIREAVPVSSLSIGPYFAAAILAAEVFKAIRGYDSSRRRIAPVSMSLWTFETYDDPSQVPNGPTELATVPVPYLVGAGAVGQAVAVTLMTSQVGPRQVVTIDGDAIDDELTNLNRYCLSVVADGGRNKASLLSGYLTRAGIQSFHFPGFWADYVQSGHTEGIPSEVCASERDSKYRFIISCVDKNTGRHDLQRMWPRLIIGSSTLGMGATAQIYDLAFDQECLMCSNPLEDDGWTLEGELERLRRLPDAEREAEAQRAGVDPALLAKHLRDPKCGTLGEAELERFRHSSSRHDWSVGFVSVGAGVMLAAAILRYFSEAPSVDKPHAFRFSFETNRAGKSRHRPNSECECQQQGRKYWRQLWG
jgi:molybdopterin/thiamine biosynthesis adenylyltransferase